jgi:hypothetical protein
VIFPKVAPRPSHDEEPTIEITDVDIDDGFANDDDRPTIEFDCIQFALQWDV